MGLKFLAHGENIRNSTGGWGIVSKEPMWTFDANQNNSYAQLLALCMFLPLLRDLRQTSTECFEVVIGTALPILGSARSHKLTG